MTECNTFDSDWSKYSNGRRVGQIDKRVEILTYLVFIYVYSGVQLRWNAYYISTL